MNTTFPSGQSAKVSSHTGAHAADECSPEGQVTRSLLGYGIVAGPFYVVVSLTQAAVRDGFDLTRHAWSLLANGTGGWVQMANLILTGVMVGAAAIGLRRALRGGAGHRWAPWLLAIYGVSLVGAGIFRADPMAGFPAGTPDGPPVAATVQGMLHVVFGGIGFLALVAATLVLAARFAGEGRRGRALLSGVTGVAFLAAFLGIASGSTSPLIVVSFVVAVLISWAWLSSTSAHLYRRVR